MDTPVRRSAPPQSSAPTLDHRDKTQRPPNQIHLPWFNSGPLCILQISLRSSQHKKISPPAIPLPTIPLPKTDASFRQKPSPIFSTSFPFFGQSPHTKFATPNGRIEHRHRNPPRPRSTTEIKLSPPKSDPSSVVQFRPSLHSPNFASQLAA